MAHEVETMMYVNNEVDQVTGKVSRFVPWHGLGTAIDHACTSAEALELAGLDWEVNSRPIYTDNGIAIPGYIANTRSSDNKVLGVVSDKYKIVQNKEAFAFTDNLLDNEAKYVTAGSLRGGKNVWMLAQLPRTKILGDDIDNYLCFTNTHDGTGAVRVFTTPVRVVCNNTLNLALNTAKRSWSCRHMGNMESKMHEASRTLELANKYMEELAKMADQLANTTVTDDRIRQIVAEMFPVDDDQSHRQLVNMEKAKTEYMVAYYMPDIAQFRNTAWGMVNAMADMVAHSSPKRNTATYQENNFERIVVGHPLLDLMLQKVTAKA